MYTVLKTNKYTVLNNVAYVYHYWLLLVLSNYSHQTLQLKCSWGYYLFY